MTIRSQLSTGGLVFLVLACSLFCIAATAAEIGGDTGYFEITSDPSGGSVYFDGSYKGTSPVTFPVYVTGSPSHTIRVTKSGYNDWQQNYQGNPAEGETISVNANLVFIPVTQQTTLIGGGKGYYYISSFPSGGSVYFDGSYKGYCPGDRTGLKHWNARPYRQRRSFRLREPGVRASPATLPMARPSR